LAKIGLTEIQAAYALSRDVAEGKLTDLEAAHELRDSYGMNLSSASAYVRKRRQMLDGERYTRTMNIKATRYYLENIFSDEGEDGLISAISAVRKHSKYYSEQGKSSLPSIMDLVSQIEHKYLSLVPKDNEAEWLLKVAASYKLPAKKRRQKLPLKGHKPKKSQVLTTVYARNQHVVAERLMIANGRCEDCGQLAPFLRKFNGLPYLEVHHRITLANGGDDTVENAIALCPNCHRRQHFG
jgi:5-methylcytosine-specific restriction protein A